MILKKHKHKNKGFPFANIYFPFDAENQHTLAAGASRSGKNGPLLEYMSEIRRRGNKFICHDRKGELASIFYRPDIDHIINLYDKRFEMTGWNIMKEIDNPHIDIPLITNSLIPETQDSFWSNAARFVLEGILHSAYEQGDISNMGIWKRLSCNANDIVHHLKDTKAYSALIAKDVLANGDLSKALYDCIQEQGVYIYIHQKNQEVTFNNALLIRFSCICTCIHSKKQWVTVSILKNSDLSKVYSCIHIENQVVENTNHVLSTNLTVYTCLQQKIQNVKSFFGKQFNCVTCPELPVIKRASQVPCNITAKEIYDGGTRTKKCQAEKYFYALNHFLSCR